MCHNGQEGTPQVIIIVDKDFEADSSSLVFKRIRKVEDKAMTLLWKRFRVAEIQAIWDLFWALCGSQADYRKWRQCDNLVKEARGNTPTEKETMEKATAKKTPAVNGNGKGGSRHIPLTILCRLKTVVLS
jgi:hypothetical protein